MNSIQQKMKFLNTTIETVPKKLQSLYRFGFSILSFREIHSLRSNSRLLSLNWHTAKSKVFRVMKSKNLLKVFSKLLLSLSIVSEKDILAVDFSDFNGFQVLMFAKQTRKGRAVPVYFEILEYPVQKNSQNIFVVNTIENLSNTLGFRPKLVFDRGFACPSIIAYLCQKKHFFVIRIKKSKGVTDKETGEILSVRESRENDFKVIAYEQKNLRIVISDIPKDNNDPWYLVTNDLRSKRETIVKTYYHRFEIEEFFRDAKRVMGLEYVKFKKKRSLAIALWFVMLGMWFVQTLEETKQDKSLREKMRLSRVRYFFEKMNAEIFSVSEGRFLREGSA